MKKVIYIMAYVLMFAAICSVSRDMLGEVHVVAWVIGNVVTATFVSTLVVGIWELVGEGL